MTVSNRHDAYAAAAADPTILSRIESRLDRSAECWRWRGCHNNFGYPVVKVLGSNRYVHRLLWVARHPEANPPSELDHVCGGGSRGCCNPDHLRPATKELNMQNLLGAHENSRSGVRGVFPHRGRWQSQIGVGGRRIFLGHHDRRQDAELLARVARYLSMPFSNLDSDVTDHEILRAYELASETVRRHLDELAGRP